MPWPYYSALFLLLGLVVGIFIGRRFAPKQLREAKESKLAFLSGFRYLLSNEPDRAIEAFTRAVSFDTETIETYFALANLFRDKGEIERAIWIHQSIITRPHLDASIRLQALYDLAIDYKKGGFFDRAINTFKEVIRRAPAKKEAYLELAQLYQVLKDWQSAYEVIERLGKITGHDYSLMLAHFQTEIGKQLQAQGEINEAEKKFKKAIKINKRCVDAYLHMGDLYLDRGDIKRALNTWKEIINLTPEYSFLVYSRFVNLSPEIEKEKVFCKLIKELEKKEDRDIFSSLFIAKYYLARKDLKKAKDLLTAALEKAPSHLTARQLLAQVYLEEGKTKEAIELLRQISKDLLPQNIYQCSQCGYEATELSWKCPQCQEWDTMKPRIEIGVNT
ncbi:MAG: tetratricopeptide repeat protein [Candidatus Desulfofervidaceae bacterium]|nr:tetratricopeptide repeat protein [Candidatus Desulfofervidaceae bacterium]MDL1970086.1 tetratricopeptide repeat protein [Candidatus Desulfofervidaceae bacterium]